MIESITLMDCCSCESTTCLAEPQNTENAPGIELAFEHPDRTFKPSSKPMEFAGAWNFGSKTNVMLAVIQLPCGQHHVSQAENAIDAMMPHLMAPLLGNFGRSELASVCGFQSICIVPHKLLAACKAASVGCQVEGQLAQAIGQAG